MHLACKLRAQADNVEAALSRRIAETESQKKRLEHQLKLVLDEMVKGIFFSFYYFLILFCLI